ncbi:MAG: hypothetical protein WCS99_07180 [Limisphaerales bacterium]
MDAREQLFAAYGDWREWTQREGDAIRAQMWAEVERCQNAKAELQGRILEFTDAAQAASRRAGLDWSSVQSEISALVAQLISMEHQNSDCLALQRSEAEAQHSDLCQAHRNLRRVHVSYGAAASSQWHSYS